MAIPDSISAWPAEQHSEALFGYLLNLFHEQIGKFHPHPERRLASRPAVDDSVRCRVYVNEPRLAECV